MKNDPLLQPFKLGSKLVKNRIFSTGHALSYAESGKPTETTFLYQQEKAKGGIGLSFVGGSGTVSLDTAPKLLIVSGETCLLYTSDAADE